MKSKIYLFICLLISLNIVGCYKDDIIKDDKVIIKKDHPIIEVSGNLVGRIKNEKGERLIGLMSHFMDDNFHMAHSNYYYYNAEKVDQNGTPISINLNDYETEFTVRPIDDDVSYFSHTIYTKPDIHDHDPNLSLNIQLTENIKLELNENSYTSSTGANLGNIIIRSFSPELDNPIGLEALPGANLGIDENENPIWLDMDKVFSIDFKASNGTEFSIKKDHVNITISDNSCTTCDIWRYDKSTHKWIIHKKINAISDELKFDIQQAGFYCLAESNLYNSISGELVIGQVPMRNLAIDIYDNERLIQRIYTSNKGKWFTQLPINRNYSFRTTIDCIPNQAFDLNVTQEDIINEQLYISPDEYEFVRLAGEIRDCDNNLVNDHFLRIKQDGKEQLIFQKKPIIDLEILKCATEIIGVQSISKSWDNIGPEQIFSATESNINFDKSYTCNNFRDGFFHLQIDGTTLEYNIIATNNNDNRTELIIYDEFNPSSVIHLLISGDEARTYQDNELNIYFDNLIIDNNSHSINCKTSTTGCGFNTFQIEYFGTEKGSWIKGNFDGSFWIKTDNPLTASYKTLKADFFVKRIF